MNEIKFVNELPPKKSAGRFSALDEEIDALKGRPGVWALVREGVNSGHTASFKSRGAQTATRNSRKHDGKTVVDIYARWPAPVEAQA